MNYNVKMSIALLNTVSENLSLKKDFPDVWEFGHYCKTYVIMLNTVSIALTATHAHIQKNGVQF